MRALQGSFARLASKLTFRHEKRRLTVLCCLLLHNYRTEFVGLNQIAEVFNVHYSEMINIDGYDRIRRYFHSVE